MIRHTVMITWKDDATDMGTDIGVNDGNWDFAVSGDFDDLDGYIAYRDDPTHQAIIATYIKSIVATRAAVQFEY